MSFFDQPARVARTKLVHAVWHRQRTEVLPGVAPVALMFAQTDDTVVALTDVRGYPNGFVFMLRLRWGLVADPDEQPPWPIPMVGSPDPLGGDPFPDELLHLGWGSPTAAGSPTWMAIPTSPKSCRRTSRS